jgi:hypothetical protein
MAARLVGLELELGEAKGLRCESAKSSFTECGFDRAKWGNGHENLNVGVEVLYTQVRS